MNVKTGQWRAIPKEIRLKILRMAMELNKKDRPKTVHQKP